MLSVKRIVSLYNVTYKDEYLIPLMKIPPNFMFLSFYKVRTKTVLKFLNILISFIQEQSEKVTKNNAEIFLKLYILKVICNDSKRV